MPALKIDYNQLDITTAIETCAALVENTSLSRYQELVFLYPQSLSGADIKNIVFGKLNVHRYVIAQSVVQGEPVWVAFVMLSKAAEVDLTGSDLAVNGIEPRTLAPLDAKDAAKVIFIHLDGNEVYTKDMSGYDFGDTITIRKRKPEWDPAFAMGTFEEAVGYLKRHCARDLLMEFTQIRIHLYDHYGWPRDARFSF